MKVTGQIHRDKVPEFTRHSGRFTEIYRALDKLAPDHWLKISCTDVKELRAAQGSSRIYLRGLAVTRTKGLDLYISKIKDNSNEG